MKRRVYKLGALLCVPPVVWAAQGLLGWWASSHGCEPIASMKLHTVRVVMLIVSLVALAATVAGLVDAVALVRAAPASAPGDIDRVRFFGTVAIVIGTTLSLGVLFATLPSFLITRCGAAQ